MENNNDFNLIDFNSAENKKPKKAEENEKEAITKVKEETAAKKAKKAPLHISSKQTKIIAAVCIVLAFLIIGITTCAINDVNPISYMASIITNDKAHLVGKWQSQETPGISAYVFNDDGTYESYLSSFKFSGEYETKGDKLILKRPGSNVRVEYKYSVKGDVFTMTLYKESNRKVKDKKTFKFDRVDSLNQKSFGDLLNKEQITEPAK